MNDDSSRMLKDLSATDRNFCDAIRMNVVSKETLVPDVPSLLNEYAATTFPPAIWGFSVTLAQPLLQDLSVIRIGERIPTNSIRKSLNALRTHSRRPLFRVEDSRLCAISLDFIPTTPVQVNLTEILRERLTFSEQNNLGIRLVCGEFRQYLLPLRRLTLQIASNQDLENFVAECFPNRNIATIEAYTFTTRTCVFSAGRWQEITGVNGFPTNDSIAVASNVISDSYLHQCCRGNNSKANAERLLPRLPVGAILAALERPLSLTATTCPDWSEVQSLLKSQRHDGSCLGACLSHPDAGSPAIGISTQCDALIKLIAYCQHEDDLSILPQITAGMEFLSQAVREYPKMNLCDQHGYARLSHLINDYEILTADRGYSWMSDVSDTGYFHDHQDPLNEKAPRCASVDSTKSNSDVATVFLKKHTQRGWGNGESVSGSGSSLARTRRLVSELPKLFAELQVHRVLDLPCGDWNWMREVDLSGIEYFGGEVVEEIVASNRKYEREGVRFQKINLVADPLPPADLILCRDCLVHLSNCEVASALRNIVSSGARFLLTTTFPGRAENRDIPTGRWRPLNLERAPFHFPPPERFVFEHCTESGGRFADKCLALWRIEVLATCVEQIRL